MATRRIPLVFTVILKTIRFFIHLAVCAGIVFVMVKTFKYMSDPKIENIDGIRAFYFLLFENVVLSGFLVYTASWTRKAIRGRPSSYYEL